MSHRKQIVAYTDGACLGNPGPGGWGAYLLCDGHEHSMSGGEPLTTNNRMELMAAIRVLEDMKVPCDVTVWTDSQYVRQGITEWMPGWIRKGWRTSSGGAVKNQDLWQRLVAAAERHHVRWEWVKGHAGNPGNERADQLASAAAHEQRNRKPAKPNGSVA